MLELNELNIFVHAVEAASFTGAAKQLHISQPAVSMQVQNLERRLNSVLFDRSGRSVHPTEAAYELLPLARKILLSVNLIEETMASLHGELNGHLQIACSSAAGKYILPHLIARFRQQHPKVRGAVGICTPDSAESQVRDGRAQLGILSGKAACRELECRLFAEDQVVLIVPASHPWRGRESVTTQELTDQPFVMREETAATRQVMQTGLLEHEIRMEDLNVVAELGSAESIVTSVEAGIGIAFISQIVAQRCIQMGRVVEVLVEGLDLKRQLNMIRHGRRAHTRILAAFWDFVEWSENPTQKKRSQPAIQVSP